VEKVVAQNREPEEHERKTVEVDGVKYDVAWEYTYIGDLCYYDFEITDNSLSDNQFFIMDTHAFAPAYNYAWKVMHIHGEVDLPSELRERIEEFMVELAVWNGSALSWMVIYELIKVCRIANQCNEDVRLYLRDLICILDRKHDVSFFDVHPSVIRKRVVDLLLEIDSTIMWSLKRRKRTPEQEALRKMIMDPNQFVYDKASKARLMKNLKGKKGDEEYLDDGE
jgi:hypothetical protein